MPSETDARTARLADLAEAVITLARDIERRRSDDPRITELTATEGIVMRYADRNPGATPSEIADAVAVQRPNVSAALRTLAAKGLIERHDDSHDARGVIVTPTPLAAENLALVRAAWAQALAPAQDAPGVEEATRALWEIRSHLEDTRDA